jgi:hypothetical protein
LNINNADKPPITQEMLKAFAAMETALNETRKLLARGVQSGREVEPGDLDINRWSLLEPSMPLVIPRQAAAALAIVSRNARHLRISA